MNAGTESRGQKFPRRSRLLKRADFEAVYQRGRRHFSANFTLFYRRREQSEHPRIGFAVGRTMGGAVERNRMRRRLREAVRRQIGLLPGAVDVVVHPKVSALKTDFAQLEGEISRAFEAVARECSGKR